MRVLFFNPARSGQGNIPLNIPLLISIVKRRHEVELFDLSDYAIFDTVTKSFEGIFFKKATFDYQLVIDERKRYYKDSFGSEVDGLELKKTDYVRDFENVLRKFKPDIIAVSSLSVDFSFACNFLDKFKQRYNIPVIFGGIHAILIPEETIKIPTCDIVCIGEGDNCLLDLLAAIENKADLKNVKGIWYKANKEVVKNAPIALTDLDYLPPPNYDLIDPIHFYRPFDGKRYKMLNYEFSRGCPYNCTYCVNGVLKQRYRGLGKFRRIKNPSKAIDELSYLVGKHNFNFIRFWDEDFTSVPMNVLKKFGDLYTQRIALPFIIYARVTSITERKVEILKDMGCKGFAMGIESGNEFIRNKVMKRKMSNGEIVYKFNIVKSFGIRVSAYNIIGLPFDTRKSIFDTVELNRIVNPDSFSVTMLEPYKGTPIRDLCEEQGLEPDHETVFGEPQFIPVGMTKEELKGLFRTFPFYIRFPKERYGEIQQAESNDEIYKKLLQDYAIYK